MKTIFLSLLLCCFVAEMATGQPQDTAKPLAPKLLNTSLSMQKAKTKPKDKRMGLGAPRLTEPVESNAVADAFKTLEAGDVKKAIAQFKPHVAKDPDAAYGMACALYLDGQTAQSITLLENLSKKYPRNTDILYELGSIYVEEGQYDKAEERFIAILMLEPEDADTWFELGDLYSLSPELYADAETCYETVLEIDPKDPDAPVELSRLNILQGRQKQALEEMETAFRNGFNDLDYLRSDPDFDRLRKLKAFDKLVAKYF